MGTVPEAYYQFVMDYAPYVYVIPPDTPDPAFGKGVLAASFAIDFLCEAYSAQQFEDRKADIYNKIVSLADWVLTQQCTRPSKEGLWRIQKRRKQHLLLQRRRLQSHTFTSKSLRTHKRFSLLGRR